LIDTHVSAVMSRPDLVILEVPQAMIVHNRSISAPAPG
jgi:hypothetical protein